MTLAGAIKDIERQFGKGAVMLLGDPSALVPVEVIPTGAATLDLALGVGGCPRGRIVEIFGPESSGKSTLTLHLLAEAQKLGHKVAFIDAEHALDPAYARAIGANPDEFVFSQPDYGEQALNIADMLISSGELAVVAVDSVAALTPKAELDGEMGQQTVGLHARMMSQAMRKLTAKASQTKTLVLFTNQLRERVGVLYGSPEVQPGGRALKFYASQRIDVRRKETVGVAGHQTHIRVKAKVVKNKCAPPLREAEFDLEFGRGISQTGCVLDLAIDKGVIAKAGAWLTIPGVPDPVQGRQAAKVLLSSEPALLTSLYQECV